jgi:hypothetical protein
MSHLVGDSLWSLSCRVDHRLIERAVLRRIGESVSDFVRAQVIAEALLPLIVRTVEKGPCIYVGHHEPIVPDSGAPSGRYGVRDMAPSSLEFG